MGNAAAELTACYTVQPGDTATYIALRFTGSAYHRHEPWFLIVDPTGPWLIPKANYGRIHPGWRTCFPETQLTSQWGHRTEIRAASRGSAANIQSVAGNPPVLLWSGAVLLLIGADRMACNVHEPEAQAGNRAGDAEFCGTLHLRIRASTQATRIRGAPARDAAATCAAPAASGHPARAEWRTQVSQLDRPPEKHDLRRRTSCGADRRYAVHDGRRVRARALGCGAVPTDD